MKLLHAMGYLTLTTSLLLAAPAQKKDPELQTVVKIGQHSTKLLLKTLGSNMKKQMKSGGPMKALDFCATQAYDLTENVNKKLEDGVSVKRISLQYRNPANQPQKEEAAVLEAFKNLQSNNVILPKHMVQKVDKNVYKFYKPLLINKQVCLKCHGNLQNGKLKDAIAKRYPTDKALHYKMGDLRGAVVVTVDTSKVKK